MDEFLIAEAAHALGMKTTEIIKVEAGEEGLLVTTHDGQTTLVRTLKFADGGTAEAPADVAPDGPGRDEPEPVEPGPVESGPVESGPVEPGPVEPGPVEPEEPQVPDGPAKTVLAWVDGDPARAAAALAAEQARPQPRKSLLAELEGAIGA